MIKSNVVWIDENIDSEEYKKFTEELKSFSKLFFNVRLLKNVDEAIERMKYILFEETKIIISDNLYPEFIKQFNENINNMCFAPKIIIFTKNKKTFFENNKDFHNNTFYNFGGVVDTFEEVKTFLKKENIDDAQLSFEYIDKKEKLLLPLFFKTLIDKISNEDMQKYTSSLYDDYSKNEKIKDLLGSIKNISNIPIEILSKYYARLYTAESDFYKNINKDLVLNKKEKCLPYIKTLYEGVKLKSLPLANKNILYRGAKISNNELKKINDYIHNKIDGLPISIVFSKSFLSFTKDKSVANYFLSYGKKDKNLSNVLFILEKDDNLEYNLSTHADIENISFRPEEREVLFFPFSSFEIKDIKETTIGNEKRYEINLLYLGKYLKDIENDENIIINEKEIPDSEFKKQLIEVGLIKKEKIQKTNSKILYNSYKEYKKDINDINNRRKKEHNIKNNKNLIIGQIDIKPDDINKDIRIINSFENIKRENKFIKDQEDDWKNENEKEIKENIEIKINGKKIKFSYYHKFEKEGKYSIEYSFKKNLTKTNHMFYYCESITNLNFSDFNAENVTNMSYMFYYCSSLTNLNFSNFNTQNVSNMSHMFYCCKSLTNLNLSYFNTLKVTTMKSMFFHCNSLENLNVSNLNTQNVIDMSGMFDDCNSLTNLNLSSFNTQNVTNMSNMFSNCTSLTNLNLSNFNTHNVIIMRMMFYGCSSLTNLNLSNFNTQNVIVMNSMFDSCESLKKLNLSSFNTQNVISMVGMFNNCTALRYLNISNFKTQNASDMSEMFRGCESLLNLDLSNFNTKNVINMSGMFVGCKSLINLNLSNFNTQNVTNMSDMFYECNSLTNLNLSNFNTENVTDMNDMFYECNSLTNLNLSNFNTRNVTDMRYMFNGCNSLKTINLSNFNTQNVTSMLLMFKGCESLKKIDLSNFNTQNVINMSGMFNGCSSLTYLNLSNFNTDKVNDLSYMFYYCKSLNRRNLITKNNKILNEFDKK